MKIAIAGSGALGASFGYMLAQTGAEVQLIDSWSKQVEAIQTNGLTVTVNGEVHHCQLPIDYPAKVKGDFDLIFMFTKSMELETMLQAISHLLKPDTKVVCLMNGLGHRQRIERYVAEKNIFMGVTVWTAGLDAPGQTHLMGEGPVELNNCDPAEEKQAKDIVALLTRANLNGVYTADIAFSTWKKACVNGTVNVLCSLLDCTMAELIQTSVAKEMMTKIVTEFSEAAATQGVTLEVAAIVPYLAGLCDTVGAHYPSMHQDLIQNHRPTEVDYLNGTIAEMAENSEFSADYCRLITQLIHGKEDVLGIVR